MLKAIVAVAVPSIDVAAGVNGALKLSMLVVVNANGVTADVLIIQLPKNSCVSDVPPLKVAECINVKSPFTINAPPAVFAPVLDRVR